MRSKIVTGLLLAMLVLLVRCADDERRDGRPESASAPAAETPNEGPSTNRGSGPEGSPGEDQPAPAGKNHALIIANNRYVDPSGGWGALKTPIGDARALKEVLEKRYGFAGNVVYLEDATRDRFYEAFKQLIAKVEENDNALIFYAGHGHFDEVIQTGYWIPVDAEGTRDSTFVSNEDIEKRVVTLSANCRHVLLISDSCFSGTFLNRSRGITIKENKTRQTEPDRYFIKKSQSKSCQVITSGGKEYVDDEFQKTGHSPFAYFLLHKLETNDEAYLSASDIAVYLQKTVLSATGQEPLSSRVKSSCDQLGEFFFVTAAAGPVTIHKPAAVEKPVVVTVPDTLPQSTYAKPERKTVCNIIAEEQDSVTFFLASAPSTKSDWKKTAPAEIQKKAADVLKVYLEKKGCRYTAGQIREFVKQGQMSDIEFKDGYMECTLTCMWY